MTQPSKNRGAASAGPAEGVASEKARSASDTDAAKAEDTADLTRCGDCGSEEIVYVTDDPAAQKVAYCATHKPANVTDKMVEEQQGSR